MASDSQLPPSASVHAPDKLEAAAAQWRTDGWALIDGLIPADQIERAIGELLASERIELGGSARRADSREGPAFRSAQFDGTTLFPISDCPTLNRLFVDPSLIKFATTALQTEDIRMYQSRVWSKHGSHTGYEQPMHRDGNHALIPITNRNPWWHLECFVYLNDVDHTNGATALVPGSVASAGLGDRSSVSPDDAPHLYDAEVLASARAGSVLAYRSDTWHRGRDLQPDTERHIIVVSFRPAGTDWIGFDAHEPLVNSPDWVAFAEQCTADELALFGIPRPGHPYWDEQVLDVMAEMYPELDLRPWRSQL